MKVLFVLENLGKGGSQRVAATLLRFLPREIELHLCLLTGDGPYLSMLPENIRIHRVRASRLLFSIKGLRGLIREIKPETIFSTVLGVDALTWVAWKISRVPSRLVFRCCTYPSSGLIRQPAHIRPWIPFAYRKAHSVIASTQEMRDDLVKTFRVKAERIHLISNPLDLDQIIEQGRIGEPAFSGAYICGMGRLIEDKGFDLMIRAFSQLPDRHRQVKLVLLGTGKTESDLRRLAVDLKVFDRIHFLGFMDNPWKLLAGARLFALTSRREGFPNALIEAMALGVPSVSTDCRSGPSEIIENEKNGLLVPVGDVQNLAAAIVRLLDNPAFALDIAAQGRKTVERFKSGPIAAEFLSVLRGP